jgi:hypothetical protein
MNSVVMVSFVIPGLNPDMAKQRLSYFQAYVQEHFEDIEVLEYMAMPADEFFDKVVEAMDLIEKAKQDEDDNGEEAYA